MSVCMNMHMSGYHYLGETVSRRCSVYVVIQITYKMNFISPEKYSKSQESHFVLNQKTVNEFVKIYGALVESDKVLDFGSGTGETTAAMAQVDC